MARYCLRPGAHSLCKCTQYLLCQSELHQCCSPAAFFYGNGFVMRKYIRNIYGSIISWWKDKSSVHRNLFPWSLTSPRVWCNRICKCTGQHQSILSTSLCSSLIYMMQKLMFMQALCTIFPWNSKDLSLMWITITTVQNNFFFILVHFHTTLHETRLPINYMFQVFPIYPLAHLESTQPCVTNVQHGHLSTAGQPGQPHSVFSVITQQTYGHIFALSIITSLYMNSSLLVSS